jgi:hypothetical protein
MRTSDCKAYNLRLAIILRQQVAPRLRIVQQTGLVLMRTFECKIHNFRLAVFVPRRVVPRPQIVLLVYSGSAIACLVLQNGLQPIVALI